MSNRLLALLLFGIGILLYIPSVFGGFIWDDEDFVYANSYVREFRVDKFFTENAVAGRGKASNYYRPIQMSSYSLLWQLTGGHPALFHLFNGLVHAAAGVVIFHFLRKWLQKPPVAFWSALLFLIHPVQTESVSYISGVSDPLYVVFGMGALYFYLDAHRSRLAYGASILLFLLSLLSKEIALAFGPIILLLEVTRKTGKSYQRIVPFVGITLLYLYYHFTVIHTLDTAATWAHIPEYANSIVVRILTFMQNVLTYLSLIFFPLHLHMERDMTTPIQTNPAHPRILLFLVLNAITIFGISKLRPAGLRSVSAFCYAAFYISLVPVSGIVLINGLFYEHFLYLPLVWFVVPLVLALQSHAPKKIAIVLLPIVIVLSLRTIIRQQDWTDAVRFYTKTIAYVPGSFRLHNNLGMAHADQGELDLAIIEYNRAMEIAPEIPNFYHNLGNIYFAKGEFETAENYYLTAIEKSPTFHFSYIFLMKLYKTTGQTENLQEVRTVFENQFQTVSPE